MVMFDEFDALFVARITSPHVQRCFWRIRGKNPNLNVGTTHRAQRYLIKSEFEPSNWVRPADAQVLQAITSTSTLNDLDCPFERGNDPITFESIRLLQIVPKVSNALTGQDRATDEVVIVPKDADRFTQRASGHRDATIVNSFASSAALRITAD